MKPTYKQDPQEESLPSAHSLREAANTDNTLEGYAAMNDVPAEAEITQEALAHPVDEHHEISRLAYQFYLDRGGENGSAEDDWSRAEAEFHSRHSR